MGAFDLTLPLAFFDWGSFREGAVVTVVYAMLRLRDPVRKKQKGRLPSCNSGVARVRSSLPAAHFGAFVIRPAELRIAAHSS